MKHSAKNPKIKIGCVGLGWVSQNRHLPAILRNPEFELRFVADRKADQAKSVAKRFNTEATTGNAVDESVLASVDAVVIGAPPFEHYHLIRQALAAGKHVLTEKPFVMTPEEGRQLVELANSSSIQLAVVHNFQFSRSFRRLEEDLSHGTLGEILSVQAVQQSNPRRRLPDWYERLPGGLFYDESPHLLYLLRRILPNLTLVDAAVKAGQNNTPAFVHAAFDSEAGVPAMLHMNFEAGISEWQILVHGHNGVGCVDLFRDIYMRIPNDGAHSAKTILQTSASAALQHAWGTLTSGLLHLRGRLDYGNDEIFSLFSHSIRSGLQPPWINGNEAFSVLELQHAIIKSKT